MKGPTFFSSALKHTKSRGNHMKNFGEGHTNEDHPNYWKENPDLGDEKVLKEKGIETSKDFYDEVEKTDMTNKETDQLRDIWKEAKARFASEYGGEKSKKQ